MKYLFSLSLFLSSLAFAGAGAPSTSSINETVAATLSQFVNQKTAVKIELNNLVNSETNTLLADATVDYLKKGSVSDFNLNINSLNYELGSGVNPLLTADANVKFEITKLIPQDQINSIVPDLETIFADLAKDYTKDYGDAAVVVAKVTQKVQDDNGNYIQVGAIINADIDLAKLPANKRKEDVAFTHAEIILNVVFAKGISAQTSIIANPTYKAFEKDQMGLKEFFEGIYNKNQTVLDGIKEQFKKVDDFIGNLVEGNIG